mmetsp:Transcript_22771/g.68357  ORF Transcript_22771/g.68357 Transcript_22771/m.68357 type:complete len:134 (+) Transcript_22771:131-532(+)
MPDSETVDDRGGAVKQAAGVLRQPTPEGETPGWGAKPLAEIFSEIGGGSANDAEAKIEEAAAAAEALGEADQYRNMQYYIKRLREAASDKHIQVGVMDVVTNGFGAMAKYEVDEIFYNSLTYILTGVNYMADP